MRYVFGVTLFGALGMIALAVWPEAFGYGCFIACLSLPGSLIALLVLVRFVSPHPRKEPSRHSRPWVIATVLVLAATPIPICSGLPWRAAFFLSQPELEAAARQISEPRTHFPGGWIGVLYVDEY